MTLCPVRVSTANVRRPARRGKRAAIGGEAIMRVVVIGGSGHVGTYLVPRLVAAGHEVVVRQPRPAAALPAARRLAAASSSVAVDRAAEEAAGTFGAHPRPAARRRHRHDLLHAGRARGSWSRRCAARCSTSCTAARSGCTATSVAVADHRGRSRAAPSASTASRRRRSRPTCWTRRGATASRRRCCIPGHIVGPGWAPLNPAGHFNPQVFATLGPRRGAGAAEPGPGDGASRPRRRRGAGVHAGASRNWSAAVGESFHVVSPAALTLRGYAEAMAAWFGREPRLALPALGGVARRHVAPEDGAGDLGSHRAQPQLQHRQGASACSATSRATPRCERSTRR